MAKLYAITSGAYSDYGIITLCSDKEKAEKLVEWYNRYEKYDKADVEEYEDGVVVPDESVKPYEVTFLNDGSLGEAEICGPYYYMFHQRMLECSDGRLIFYVLATDEESAKKIAAEKRAFHLAQREGI